MQSSDFWEVELGIVKSHFPLYSYKCMYMTYFAVRMSLWIYGNENHDKILCLHSWQEILGFFPRNVLGMEGHVIM